MKKEASNCKAYMYDIVGPETAGCHIVIPLQTLQ